MPLSPPPPEPRVVRLAESDLASVTRLLHHHGLALVQLAPGSEIPGSYWGETEAGLIGATIYARPDTPLHSLLHEACHFICMDAARRSALHTDAGGTDQEEVAVCYLQALLADDIAGYSRAKLFADMDAWGYHFRLASAQAWFEGDAEDALEWLQRRGLARSEAVDSGASRSTTS